MFIHFTSMCRVFYEPSLLCAMSVWMIISWSTLFSLSSNYYACHSYLVIVWHAFSNEKLLCESYKTAHFYIHGPSSLWAEFVICEIVIGRVCYGPSYPGTAVKREFEAGLRHATTGKLSAVNGFFELGKDKAAKGERWAPLSSAVPKIQSDSNPNCPYGYQAIGNHYLYLTDYLFQWFHCPHWISSARSLDFPTI